MGVIVFLFSQLGQWLDHKFLNENNIYVKILTMVGVALAFYNISRQLKEINKSEEE
jgi:F0F1-type ATP synthase assembly protein I